MRRISRVLQLLGSCRIRKLGVFTSEPNKGGVGAGDGGRKCGFLVSQG